METNCRVCGYFYDYPIWGEDGMTPSYEICPCCGGEVGVDDYQIAVVREYRSRWIIEKAGVWFRPREKPKDWDFFAQMKNVSESWI